MRKVTRCQCSVARQRGQHRVWADCGHGGSGRQWPVSAPSPSTQSTDRHGQHSQQIDTVNMKLGTMGPALACSGPMSTFSYDSHPISRARWAQQSRAANEPSAKFAALIKPSRSDHCSGCLMWPSCAGTGAGVTSCRGCTGARPRRRAGRATASPTWTSRYSASPGSSTRPSMASMRASKK